MMRTLQAEELAALAPRLLEIQHAAYAIEAALIGDDRIPPLHETEADLVSAGLEWLATFDGDRISGAVGYSIDDGVVDIDRLVIDPEYHRKGLGSALVTHVMSLAPRAVVSTGRANGPARALYETLGFVHDSDAEPLPGLWVSQYAREQTAPRNDD